MKALSPTVVASTLLAASSLLPPVPAPAQSDRDVTTTRIRDANTLPLPDGAVISDQPRYYLDTVDTLNRVTTDLTRPAPGLAKNNYIARVFEVRNTDAIHIQSYLLRSLAYEGGTAEVMAAEDVAGANGGSSEYLFVTAPDFMMPGIEEIVAVTDRPGFIFYDGTADDFGKGSGAIQYVGKNRTASELVNILKGTELGNVGAFLFPPFADDSTNSIYIVDNPIDIADNVAALELFDRRPLQMELDVTIYEVGISNGGTLGLDWDAWKRGLTGGTTYTSTGDNPFDDGSWETVLSLDARVLADFLNFTVQTGTSRIVTSTRVTMVNSEDNPGALSGGQRGTRTGFPAVIQSINTIPFSTLQDDVGPTNSTNSYNEVIDTTFEGVRLEVLPFIGTQSVTLDLRLTVNSLIGYSKGTNVPIISTREMNSVVNAENGEALVTGGLDRVSVVKSRVGLPGLKDLPGLQYLFSKETERRETTKIVIALMPRLNMGGTAEETLGVHLKEFRPVIGAPRPSEVRVRSHELDEGALLDSPGGDQD